MRSRRDRRDEAGAARVLGWLAILAVISVTPLIITTQRARPSYLFPLGLAVMARTFGQNQPVLLEKQPEKQPEPGLSPRTAAPKVRRSRFPLIASLFAAALALFWVGVCAAFLFGYWGPAGLAALNLQTDALVAAAVLLPPFFFLAMAAALSRAVAMQDAARGTQVGAHAHRRDDAFGRRLGQLHAQEAGQERLQELLELFEVHRGPSVAGCQCSRGLTPAPAVSSGAGMLSAMTAGSSATDATRESGIRRTGSSGVELHAATMRYPLPGCRSSTSTMSSIE